MMVRNITRGTATTAQPQVRAAPCSLVFVSSLSGWGGGEQWMLSAAGAMSRRGHRVTLVARPGSALIQRATAAGLDARPVELGGWLDPRSLGGLAMVLRDVQADTVCVNLDKEIRQAAMAARLVRSWRPPRLVARRGSPDPIKNNWHYRWVYNRWLDRLICNAEALVEKVCGSAPWFDRGKVRVIPNGVDAAALADQALALGGRSATRGALHLREDHVCVLCVGEVGWRKGHEILLRAAVRLRDRYPEMVVVIAGDGDGRRELTERARRDGLLDDGTVRFLGFRDDVPALLSACDVLVLPSRREGFPNALLEGMALARPVVATRADGIPELVADQETGALVAVDDENGFTEQLAVLLADGERRRRWGEAGRERSVTHFSEQHVTDLLDDTLCRWS